MWNKAEETEKKEKKRKKEGAKEREENASEGGRKYHKDYLNVPKLSVKGGLLPFSRNAFFNFVLLCFDFFFLLLLFLFFFPFLPSFFSFVSFSYFFLRLWLILNFLLSYFLFSF